ncbi:MAG: hypothetical protein QOF14_1252, partial [Hyphomicrobiales bacterium]|nr:hypothetical protein [Hyphomicrobiales bacterium]
MQFRRPHRGFTREAIANIGHRYQNTDEPQSSIAADYGVHRKTIETLAKAEGWVMRKDRAPRDLPPDLRLDIEAEQAVHAVAETSVAAKQADEHEASQAEG